ncbi:ATP-grasp domain-containing protein [Micromonospora sp. WMMD961]|uniref:ATP-grasp domain-containing protein n=1 Tax=Micromonospora sp. WMMD961 TaxID=3016100 RepID=UPI0024174630|nr:ATP-grasp domain-containing protein [Micromonospora sp. WMMD961]MDG4780078.1 ATP-grasp domain-containing protein [Micromonospora sp. WMMD961]
MLNRSVERGEPLRDDDLVGGFVLRRFERFASAEARTWWVGGVFVLIGAHPDSQTILPHRSK